MIDPIMIDPNPKNDPRILDFRKQNLILPKNFPKNNREMILACGDGFHIRYTTDDSYCKTGTMCDIEFYTTCSYKEHYNIM